MTASLLMSGRWFINRSYKRLLFVLVTVANILGAVVSRNGAAPCFSVNSIPFCLLAFFSSLSALAVEWNSPNPDSRSGYFSANANAIYPPRLWPITVACSISSASSISFYTVATPSMLTSLISSEVPMPGKSGAITR